MIDRMVRHQGTASALAGALILGTATVQAQDEPPFGDEASVAYAEQVWQALVDADLVGEGAIRSYAYQGSEPHGIVLEQVETKLTVDGHEGDMIVKSNFFAEGLTTADVMNSARDEHLVATTIMFKREAGYSPESADWFWAKYLPGGELDTAPNDLQLAGKVHGCIGCHGGAEGGDFVFLHDRFAE